MSRAETVRLLLFLGLVVFTYVRAGAVILNYALGRQNSRNSPVFLAMAAAGILCMAFGYFVEPNWLEVTHVSVRSSKIPSGIKPVRIAHISDIHSDPTARLEERVADAIETEHPDVIVFTGDSINSREALPVFKALMARLVRVAPTFVVRGNWDAWYWMDVALFDGTGVHELNGTIERVEIRGVNLWFSGIGVTNEALVDETLGRVPSDAFSVFLYHYPDLIEQVSQRSVDLYCAGHTHGGQVALPLYGALVTFSKYGKRYEAGLYREKDTTMYVNRGIGMEGGSVPRVRFWSRPELTIIDLVPVTS